MAKVKDVNNDNSPHSCLRQTASRSYDQPYSFINGGGGVTRSTHT